MNTKLWLNDEKTPINTSEKRNEKKISEESIKNHEDFTTKLAEENLEEVSNILLKVCISDLIHILKWGTF